MHPLSYQQQRGGVADWRERDGEFECKWRSWKGIRQATLLVVLEWNFLEWNFSVAFSRFPLPSLDKGRGGLCCRRHRAPSAASPWAGSGAWFSWHQRIIMASLAVLCACEEDGALGIWSRARRNAFRKEAREGAGALWASRSSLGVERGGLSSRPGQAQPFAGRICSGDDYKAHFPAHRRVVVL